MIMIRAALLCVLSLFLCETAAAQEQLSGRVVWYGVYTVSKSQAIKDPTSPTGNRYVSTPVAPAVNSDRIPGKQIRFGLDYVLTGKPGTEVTVKHVYRFPPGGMPDTNTGGPRSTYEFIRKARFGEHVLMGWSFEGATRERIVLGAWAFEVWQGGRKLVEKRLTVVPP